MRTTLTARLHILLLPAILLAAALAPRASAQVEPIDPVWMVAARDTPLRCGELSTFYEVATLERGKVVRVDGRNARWARVIYPEGLFGFVRKEEATDVDLGPDGTGTMKIAELSSIKAPNRISGLSGSWKRIYTLGELDQDATVKVIGEALSKDGQMLGYRVEPPQPPVVDHPPYGFVQLAALRDATEAEIEAHKAAMKKRADAGAAAETPKGNDNARSPGQAAGESNARPANTQNDTDSSASDAGAADGARSDDTASETSEDAPANARENTAEATTKTGDPETDPETDTEPAPADDSLVDDMAIPTPEELAGDSAESEESDEGQTDTAAPAAGSQTQPTAQPTPQQRDYLRFEELEATLTRVRRAGGGTLMDSLDELIAEYERSLTNADTPAIREALSNRLEWLRLRKKARDQRLALRAALEDAKQVTVDARREQDRWRAARGYDIVGRLVPSAIYDGTDLPRMYRIVVEGEAGLTRTIGYVRDNNELGIAQLVGNIVGVAGEARYDDALRLRIITPTAIDRFRPASAPSAAP